MSPPLTLPPNGPPLGRLALLTLAVLGLHLGLLTGFPSWTGGNDPGDFTVLGETGTEPSGADSAAAQASPTGTPRSVERSSVRWLLVPPPPPPPPPPAPVRRTPLVQPLKAQPTPAPTPPAEPPSAPMALAGEQPWTLEPALEPPPERVSTPVDPPPAAQARETHVIEPPVATPAPPAASPLASATDSPGTSPLPTQRSGSLPAFRTQGLPPARPPASTRLVYDVSGQAKGLNYHASGTLDWQHDGQAYQAQMRVSAFMVGSRTQRSAGQLHATGLHPDRFTDISRRERETRFDGDQARIGYTGLVQQDPLQTGAQDRLSIILQLASRFNAKAPTAGERMSFQVAGVASAEPWEFEVLGQEGISVPAGDFTAWHVRRVARQEGDARMSVWMAPNLDFLPVRLLLTQANGDQLEQTLRRMP